MGPGFGFRGAGLAARWRWYSWYLLGRGTIVLFEEVSIVVRVVRVASLGGGVIK